MSKRTTGMILTAALAVLLLASCGMISGSRIPAGTYVLETDSGVWTLVLGQDTFYYKQESSTGTQLVGYKGTFDGLEGLGLDEYTADLTSLEQWTSGTDYSEVTLSDQTIELVYYSDYPLDDVDAKSVSFKLDTNGDGSYSKFSGNVTILGMNLQ